MKHASDEISQATLFLDRFEGSKAVLVGEREEIVVPKRLIPKKVDEGGVVHLTISSDEAETKRRTQTAKELLNEILKNQK